MDVSELDFQRISKQRYRVLRPDSDVSEHERELADRKAVDPRFLGTVTKEEFVSYPHGKPVQRHFWLARSKGFVLVGKTHTTRQSAAASLAGITNSDTNRVFVGSLPGRTLKEAA